MLFVYVIWSYLSGALCQGPISQSLDAWGARSLARSLFRLLIRSFARSLVNYCFCDVCIALGKVGVDILFLLSPNNSGSVLALASNFDVCVDLCCPSAILLSMFRATDGGGGAADLRVRRGLSKGKGNCVRCRNLVQKKKCQERSRAGLRDLVWRDRLSFKRVMASNSAPLLAAAEDSFFFAKQATNDAGHCTVRWRNSKALSVFCNVGLNQDLSLIVLRMIVLRL